MNKTRSRSGQLMQLQIVVAKLGWSDRIYVGLEPITCYTSHPVYKALMTSS